MALSAEIIAKLGLNSEGFPRGLSQARTGVEKFGGEASRTLERSFSGANIFKSFLGGFGVGTALGVFNKITSALSEAAAFSGRLADKMAEVGANARSASESIARIGKTEPEIIGLLDNKLANLKKAREGLVNASGSKSFFGGLIDRGSAFDKLFGFSRDEDLARAEKIKEINKQIGDTVVELATKKNSVEKQAAGDAKAAAAEKTKIEQAATAEIEKQRLAKADLVRQSNLAQAAAYNTYLAEQATTAELQKQLDAIMQMEQLKGKAELVSESTLYAGGRAFGASRNQRDIEQASSDALQELIRRARADIGFVEQTKGRGPTASADIASGFIIQGSIIARLQTDIQRAQFQLDQRNRAEADTAFGGTAAARRNFQGDPLEFDRFYQQNGKALAENTSLLRDLKTRLSEPLQVLAINQPSPFPR